MIDTHVIQQKLYEGLKESGWADKLKTFLLGSEFTKILLQLHDLKVKGGPDYHITPKIKDVFNAFKECPYKDLKVVIMAMDPYKHLGQACGVAMDCRNLGREEKTLKYLFDAINRTVYPGEAYSRDVNLSRWSKQGVLLLNAALTTQMGESGKHLRIWAPWTAFLLDTLNTINSGLFFVYLGNDAHPFGKYISPVVHYNRYISHPASAGYKGERTWDCKDIFNEINETLWQNNKTKIVW